MGGSTFYTGGCNSPFYWQQPDSFAFLFTTKGPGWRSETSKRTTWRRLLSLHTFHCQWQVVMKYEKYFQTEKNHNLLFSITGVHWLLILPENSWCVDFSTENFRILSFRCVGIFQLGQTCSFINTRLSHGVSFQRTFDVSWWE